MEQNKKPLAKFVFAFALFAMMYKGFKYIIQKIDKNVEKKE
ncbi:hypothetical protein ACFLYK_01120 [Candidatus Cloacimonadota bacterium]